MQQLAKDTPLPETTFTDPAAFTTTAPASPAGAVVGLTAAPFETRVISVELPWSKKLTDGVVLLLAVTVKVVDIEDIPELAVTVTL